MSRNDHRRSEPAIEKGVTDVPPATGDPVASNPLAEESVAVVGAGFGGLATAAYLGSLGADVTVFERGDHPGGAAGRIVEDGFRFDTGPSWYLMPDAFERFFSHFGRSASEYYDLHHLDPHYRVFWKDGDRVDVTGDRAAMADLFESYETGAGEAFEEYLDTAARAYKIGMEQFVYRDRSEFRSFVDTDLLKDTDTARFFASKVTEYLQPMGEYVADRFEHPKLRQLLQYTLVFLGGAPRNTPALYSLMSHVDFGMGVYYPEGGVMSVVDGLTELAGEFGAAVETGTEVTSIAPVGGTVRVETETGPGAGGRVFDRVVANANPAHVDRDLLPAGRTERSDWDDRTYAPSAFMLYLGVEGNVSPLAHHTLVLPTDWEAHFDAIFDTPRWPDDPAYYLSVPSRTDDTVAPDGHEAVVVLVPVAPGIDDGPKPRERYREKVLTDVAEHTGVDLRGRVVFERSACVAEFADRLRAPGGSALGLAHTLTQTGPFRPGHRSSAMDRLYYAGSYTAPGIGMPMTLVSGEHTAAAVRKDAADGARSESGSRSLASLATAFGVGRSD